MNRQEMVKWELVEQAVWLVALAAAAVILLVQSIGAPAQQIPVTGAGVQSKVVYEVQPQDLSSFCLGDIQAGAELKELDSTY